MFRLLKWLVLGLLIIYSEAANPDRPRSPGPQNPQADCSQPQGFSGIGLKRVHTSGLVSYKDDLTSLGPGFNKETGEYTVYCPGTYLVSFAVSRSERGTLKKRGSTTTSWTDVVSISNSGFNQVILNLESGDQIGVFGRQVTATVPEPVPTFTFTAFLLSKK